MVLETERLILRPLRMNDWNAYCQSHHDPEMQRYERPPRNSFGAVSNLFVRLLLLRVFSHLEQPSLSYAVCSKLTGQFVGCIISTGTWLGFSIARREWGKGYATEAAETLLMHVFTATKQEIIYVGCYAGNKASLRLIQKLGFVPFEKTKPFLDQENSEYQALYFSLTKDQYLSRASVSK